MSQFDNLSIAELEKARAEIDGLIEKRKAEAKSNLLAKFKQEAKDLGIDFNELVKMKSSSGSTLPAKYRDLENPKNTWSGRGHKPKWLKAKIEAGAKIEDFEVTA